MFSFCVNLLYVFTLSGACSTADSRLAEYEDIEGPTLEAGTSGLAERFRLIDYPPCPAKGGVISSDPQDRSHPRRIERMGPDYQGKGNGGFTT